MIRADVFLFRNGFAESRESARRSIEAGMAVIDGKIISKPSEQINEEIQHDVICEKTIPYVGRGGLKLEAAVNAFGINAEGAVAVDIGASTGGFTDCLLQKGAEKVFAVDSGHGQLAEKLMSDPRVVSIEGLNARDLSLSVLGMKCDIAVMDVSFISQTYILPRIPELLKPEGIAVTLIKPQFELDKSRLGKGGIVRDPSARRAAAERVAEAAENCGLFLDNIIRSPITGGDGNKEYLALFTLEKHKDYRTLFKMSDFV